MLPPKVQERKLVVVENARGQSRVIQNKAQNSPKKPHYIWWSLVYFHNLKQFIQKRLIISTFNNYSNLLKKTTIEAKQL